MKNYNLIFVLILTIFLINLDIAVAIKSAPKKKNVPKKTVKNIKKNTDKKIEAPKSNIDEGKEEINVAVEEAIVDNQNSNNEINEVNVKKEKPQTQLIKKTTSKNIPKKPASKAPAKKKTSQAPAKKKASVVKNTKQQKKKKLTTSAKKVIIAPVITAKENALNKIKEAKKVIKENKAILNDKNKQTLEEKKTKVLKEIQEMMQEEKDDVNDFIDKIYELEDNDLKTFHVSKAHDILNKKEYYRFDSEFFSISLHDVKVEGNEIVHNSGDRYMINNQPLKKI